MMALMLMVVMSNIAHAHANRQHSDRVAFTDNTPSIDGRGWWMVETIFVR